MKARQIALWPNARAFDFDLRRGEVVGIAGLDGQGQDAFVRVLAGVAAASQGLVQVAGRDGDWAPVRNLAEAVAGKVAYVSGDRKREGIFASLSIFENMVMPLYREKKRGGVLGFIDRGTLTTIFKREAENLLIKFGVKEDRITSLSGGNQQKVLIGRGFAMRPDVIILNDPARGIDVGAKTELYRHLRNYAEEGRAVVYLSSEIEEFLGFATRVIVFRDGAPFDAFEGRGLEPKKVLEAMFGQTGGEGLTSRSHGLQPGQTPETTQPGDRVASDGPRIHVHVPSRLKPLPAGVELLAMTEAPHTQTKPAIKPIRIVEFDEHGAPTERGRP
ncbi:ATP-binding cassette domain-containing protein [Rhizobium sp. G21]|uniref:ATP-binding cassette domain-containing protein n=1 Tax=Rhizobium sp. G21 TaxID=2758439 RepID=UPI001FEEA23E|nr:ATP-binding cassette domain-containing protein [Rhizobium sp. G21]